MDLLGLMFNGGCGLVVASYNPRLAFPCIQKLTSELALNKT